MNKNENSINHVNQSDSNDTKVLFDDTVINEIIASNSENITTYKLKIDNILKPDRKSTYLHPNSFKSNNNYKSTVNITVLLFIIFIYSFIYSFI